MSAIKSSTESDKLNSANKNIGKYSFEWTIENFSHHEIRNNGRIKSPLYVSEKNSTMKWCLCMHLVRNDSQHKNHISLQLKLVDFDGIELTVQCRFYILSVNGEIKHTKAVKIKKLNKENQFSFWRLFLQRDLLHSDDNELLPNGNLTVGCEIFYYYGTENTVNLSKNNNINKSSDESLNDMTFLLNSPQSADCVIKVRATEIKVHKNILASRSKVFDSILMNEQCESNSNIIEINGFPLKVVKEMINYLYSGKSPNMDKMAFLMLKIAEKYKLKQLKLMAEKSLIHSLSIGNACDHLLFSERHSCKILKEWCLRFIYLNAEKVFNTEKWKVVLNDHPLLVAELFNIAVGIN